MKKTLLISVFILLFASQQAFNQDRLPFREYTNPDELVILSQDVSFADALTILEQLSVEFTDKIFVNQTSYEGPIGIEIPQMHWEDALSRIAEYNDMYITEYAKYYEIQNIPTDPTLQNNGQGGDEPEIQVDYRSREIEISATFFQGDRSIIRELGVDWSTLQDGRVRVQNSAAIDVSRDMFEVELNWSEIFSSGWEINSLFRAFEQSNNGEVLSSPSIKVLDGRTGTIQVGQDFSIKQRDFAGNITDEFFSTGTILNVTPNVYYSSEGTPFIYMTLETERSTAQPDPVSTIVNKQEATTEVLMLSGESTVIAGLYETEVISTRRGVPFLKDLPGWFLGLRYLFGYNSREQNVQELVVLLKVELVPTLEERFNRPFEQHPELLEEQRRKFQQEIQEMQKKQSLRREQQQPDRQQESQVQRETNPLTNHLPGPEDPCEDEIYLELQKIKLEDMTDPQFQIFEQKNQACNEFWNLVRPSEQTAEPEMSTTPSIQKPDGSVTKYLIFSGFVGTAASLFLLTD